MRFALIAVFLMLPSLPGFSIVKERYGGNLKAAEDLLSEIFSVTLFIPGEDGVRPAFPLEYRIESNILKVDIRFLPPDQQSMLERHTEEIQDPASACHWILDYPYFDHRHENALTIEEGSYTIRAGEAEFLQTLMLSSCLVPETLSSFLTFRRTQFGYEANTAALSGRPFVDSITPVPVDPGNPYLSFKLGDVDVFTVPEERFQQLGQDPDLQMTEGPSYLIFLNITGIPQKYIPAVRNSVRAVELSRSALNDHAEILLPAEEQESTVVPDVALTVSIPENPPFQLMGERLIIQLKEAGFKLERPNQDSSASIRLIAVQVREADTDLFYYRVLKEKLHVQSEDSWFEEWDRRRAAGEIVPLFLYHSRIAVRKNLMHSSFVSGRPDFSNYWFLETP